MQRTTNLEKGSNWWSRSVPNPPSLPPSFPPSHSCSSSSSGFLWRYNLHTINDSIPWAVVMVHIYVNHLPEQGREHFHHHRELLCTRSQPIIHCLPSCPEAADLVSSPWAALACFYTLEMGSYCMDLVCVFGFSSPTLSF